MFIFDVEYCTECGGALMVVAAILEKQQNNISISQKSYSDGTLTPDVQRCGVFRWNLQYLSVCEIHTSTKKM